MISKSTFLERVTAFIIDFIMISCIAIIPIVGCAIIMLIIGLKAGWTEDEFNYITPIVLFFTLLISMAVLVLVKDIKNGQSKGKKIMRIAVRDLSNPKQIPGKTKLILRNITLILWPIEIILLLLLKKRIGDMISSTCVVYDNVD